MSSIDEIYKPSVNFLKATDIPAGSIREAEIKKIEIKDFNDGKKLSLVLEDDKVFVLNSTNAKQLSTSFGTPDYEKWIGKKFKIIRMKTNYNGNMVDCLRVV